MKKHFLMLKQHQITRLKYLCYHYGTRESCTRYRGSGLYWTSHYRKHKPLIDTYIIFESDSRDSISLMGIYYSKIWSVVESKEFANLTVECAQTTAEPIQRSEVRKRAVESRLGRIQVHGLTQKEKAAKAKVIKILQTPDIRKKAVKSLVTRIQQQGFTVREIAARQNRVERIAAGNYTEKELQSYKVCSERQKGKTMQQRLKDPNYTDIRKGQTAQEIYGLNYKNINQKDFELKINDLVIDVCSYSILRKKYKISNAIIRKAKTAEGYCVKRNNKTKHSFQNNYIVFIREL